MSKVNEQYLKGFNYAYLLAQHKSELMSKLLETSSSNEFIKGLRGGRDTFEQSKLKDRTQVLNEIHKERDQDRELEP